nr:MAG TPA_asm: hypothetical protein [Caudoviricetes sp.]
MFVAYNEFYKLFKIHCLYSLLSIILLRLGCILPRVSFVVKHFFTT